MDGCLILAANNYWLQPSTWWAILQVMIGLGAVIFVHELGHFLLAKACGVKCDKFYVCLLYTSPSPRDGLLSRMPSSA